MSVFCLLVCLGFIDPLANFSLILRRHHCRWRAANFDLCSALMAIDQWVVFNVPHLLWHGPTLYNGHLRGPVTLTPVAERLAVELSLPVFTTQVCRDRWSDPDLPHARRTLYLYAAAAVSWFDTWCLYFIFISYVGITKRDQQLKYLITKCIFVYIYVLNAQINKTVIKEAY